MNKLLSKIRDFVLASEIRIALIVLLFSIVLVSIISFHYYSDKDFLIGILVEAHGMLLDILVIGVFILWLNLHKNKRERLLRYQEEIDDFREWKSEEASHRIAGNIRRINKAGVKKIILSRCYLRKADLRKVILNESPMHGIDLGESRLRGSELKETILDTAFLGNCDLRGAIFDGSNLIRARIIESNANGASFRNINFTKANISHSTFRSVNFQGSDFTETIFIGVDMANADLRNVKNLNAESLMRAKNLGYTKFDSHIEALIREKRPQLLDSYKAE